jgi:hypothetical protein
VNLSGFKYLRTKLGFSDAEYVRKPIKGARLTIYDADDKPIVDTFIRLDLMATTNEARGLAEAHGTLLREMVLHRFVDALAVLARDHLRRVRPTQSTAA